MTVGDGARVLFGHFVRSFILFQLKAMHASQKTQLTNTKDHNGWLEKSLWQGLELASKLYGNDNNELCCLLNAKCYRKIKQFFFLIRETKYVNVVHSNIIGEIINFVYR